MGEKETLSTARRRAVQALVSAASFEEAAQKARVRKETLWRWLGQDAAFRDAVQAERRRQRTEACMATEAMLSAAVETLEKVMADESLPAEVRVEASRATFEVAIQLYKLTALEERIAALEDWSKARAAKTEGVGELQKGAAAAAERAA